MPVFVDGKRVGVTHELQEDDDWHNGYGASLAVEVGRLGAAGGGEGRMRTRPAIRTRAMGTRRGVSGMIDNGYPLRKAMDGGFRPPKEARDREAAWSGWPRSRTSKYSERSGPSSGGQHCCAGSGCRGNE